MTQEELLLFVVKQKELIEKKRSRSDRKEFVYYCNGQIDMLDYIYSLLKENDNE